MSSSLENTDRSSPAPTDESGYVPIRDAVAKVHSSLKDSSFGIVRSAVSMAETIGDKAMGYVPDTVVQSVNQYGSPLIDQIDHQMSNAFTRLNAFKSSANGGDPAQAYLMPAEWFTAVDQALRNSSVNQTMKLSSSDLGVLLQTFCMAASYQFLTLQRSGSSSSDAFIAALKPELDRVWNDQLIEPARAFYEEAVKSYNGSVEDGSAKDFTTRSFIEQLRPSLSSAWENQVRTSFQAINEGSQIVFVSALHEFSQLRSKSKSSNTPISELRADFVEAMKRKIGGVWNADIEKQINELFDVWTDRAARRDSSPAARILDRYQYVLLTAQQVFDRVLPPVSTEAKPDDEVKQPEVESTAENASITSLVGHVTGRIQERGVVSNVTTASTNSVREGVALAQTGVREGVALAQTGVREGVALAQGVAHKVIDPVKNVAHKVIDPVVQGAHQAASPYVDAAKPVVNAVQQQLQHKQAAIQAQLNEALAATRARIDALQAYLMSVTQATKDSVVNTTTAAASTLQASLPESVTTRLNDVQTRLSSAAKYAQELKAEGSAAAVQEIAQISAAYAELARSTLTQQISSLSSQLNTEKLSALAEEARVSVAQMLHYTKRQLDLERGVVDESESDVIDDSSFAQ